MKLTACDSTGTEINFSRRENSNERSDVGRKINTNKGDFSIFIYLHFAILHLRILI